LTECLSLYELREALASLPKTLDDTYARILCNIPEKRSQCVIKLLQWLVYSARPLQIEEIAEVVAEVIAVDTEGHPRFNPDRRFLEPEDIERICSSLVTIAGAEIRLAHFSVEEYLVSERIQNGPARQYSIRKIPTHISIAEICLAYLLQFDKANCLTRRTTEEYPLARYAAKYWTQHARAAEWDAEAMHQLIMQFFWSKRDAYVNWVQLFDLDEPWQEPKITEDWKKVASPLYYASLAGLIKSVRLLLEKGADINAQGGYYGNALQAASWKGHDQIVQRLLEQGADVNAQGGFYGNALQAASMRGYDQIIQRLLEQGANVNAQGGDYGNALQAALAGGHDQIVQRLLEQGADVNAQGGFYGNALQVASMRGYDQIIQRLLEQGANVNAQGGDYGNALQAASWEGHDQIVQRLLEQGPDVNAQGGFYGNALQAASAGGHDQIVQRLLEQGADVNAQGGNFGNALQAASWVGHNQIVQRLLERGALDTPPMPSHL
jgi:ankyrin repeat protein